MKCELVDYSQDKCKGKKLKEKISVSSFELLLISALELEDSVNKK